MSSTAGSRFNTSWVSCGNASIGCDASIWQGLISPPTFSPVHLHLLPTSTQFYTHTARRGTKRHSPSTASTCSPRKHAGKAMYGPNRGGEYHRKLRCKRLMWRRRDLHAPDACTACIAALVAPSWVCMDAGQNVATTGPTMPYFVCSPPFPEPHRARCCPGWQTRAPSYWQSAAPYTRVAAGTEPGAANAQPQAPGTCGSAKTGWYFQF